MSCPSSEQIARLLAEDLPLAEARTLEQHFEGCPACTIRRDRVQQLTTAVAAPMAGLDDSADRFVRETMARIARPGMLPAARALPWKLLTAAAIVLVALPLGFLVGSQWSRQQGSFVARGRALGRGSDLAALAGVEPLRVIGANATPLKRESRIAVGDRLGFRYSNLSDEQLYLLAFAVDHRGEVHWFYPAYLGEDTDPAAVPLAPQARQRPLPEVVQPEDVAAGPLRLVTVIAREPMRVKQVERIVQGHRGPLAPLFPDAVTQQWKLRVEVADEPR